MTGHHPFPPPRREYDQANERWVDACGGDTAAMQTTGPLGDPVNPKDIVGSRKVPISAVPQPVLGEVALAMDEGARKYSRHNYRVAPVRASIYFDANWRHMAAWWEGQDIDIESRSRLHHISKAIASLVVLRDAIMNGTFIDDRPPKFVDQRWLENQNEQAAALVDAFPNPKPPFTEKK